MPSNLLLEKCGDLMKFSKIFTIQPAQLNQPAFWAAYEDFGLFGISYLIQFHFFTPTFFSFKEKLFQIRSY